MNNGKTKNYIYTIRFSNEAFTVEVQQYIEKPSKYEFHEFVMV